jgi:hypothetical protein
MDKFAEERIKEIYGDSWPGPDAEPMEILNKILEVTEEYSGRRLSSEELEIYHLKRTILDERLKILGKTCQEKEKENPDTSS